MSVFILHKRLEELTKIYNQKPAILFKREDVYETLTFSQFLETAKKIGYFLIQQGAKRQENIGLFLENQPMWGCIYFGILFSGCVVVPLDAQLNSDELRNIFNDASVRIVFTSKSLLQKISTFGAEIKTILVDEIEEALIKDVNILQDFIWPKTDLNTLCSLVYTSGTTSKPKAVMLTHRNFSADINSILKLGLLKESDNLLCILPLHHTYPFMVNLLLPLYLGAKTTYLNSLRSEELLRCMREAAVTILVGVPQLFSLLLNGIKEKIKDVPFFIRLFLTMVIQILWWVRRFKGINLARRLFKKIHNNFGKDLRILASGGAKLDPEVAKGLFKLGFTVLEGYGLTETAPVVSFNLPTRFKIGSVGRPISDVEIRINNPDKDGVGEVLIRGENVMLGYYKNPDLSVQAIKGGWFYSGDLGYLDEDGFLYITGRTKEVIVLASGKNIYPEELEAFYKQSNYVKELCILEAYDKERRQEGLYALVVPDMEYFSKTKLSDIQGTISWELDNLSRRLPSFKRLMGFVISTEDLPRTRLGKIQRYKVKQIYESKVSAQKRKQEQTPRLFDAEALSKAKLSYKVIAFLTKELNIQVKPGDHLELDLGVDSLKRVELGLSLEKFLGVKLPEEALSEVFTVRELISKLEEFVKGESVSADLKTTDQLWKELLSQQPSLSVSKKIKLHPGIFNKLFTFVATKIFYLVFLFFCFFRIKGRANLPQKGPYILCANHTSYLDALIIASSLPLKIQLQLFFLGHTDIFELAFFRWLVTIARIIPIDPSVNLVDAMQATSYILKNSKIACIFPEGQRNIEGKIGEFKNGVGILIKELDIPCVPVYIQGTYQAWSRTRVFPRPYPIKITFGKGYRKEGLKVIGKKHTDSRDDYTLITQGLRQIIIDLKGN